MGQNEQGLREVIRCEHCALLQYHTQNGKCRRCGVDYVILQAPDTPPAPLPKPKKKFGGLNPDVCPKGDGLGGLPLGIIIRELRLCGGMTQDQLAAKAKTPRAYISRVENNFLVPGIKMVSRLCRALDISLPAFLCKVESQWEPDDIKEIMAYTKELRGEDIMMVAQSAARILNNQNCENNP